MKEAEKFYEWLLKMKNIYLADNERMAKAYGKVTQNSLEMEGKLTRLQ